MSPPNQVNAAASSCTHGCARTPSPGPSHPRTAARTEGIPGRPGSEAGADGRARAPAGGGSPDFASTRGSKVADGGRRGSSGTTQATRPPAQIHAPLEAHRRGRRRIWPRAASPSLRRPLGAVLLPRVACGPPSPSASGDTSGPGRRLRRRRTGAGDGAAAWSRFCGRRGRWQL